MKYPQLVSPRAVNAISDWLVSRLENLGVESPQIYTRLLLSLLQSSVQVNDPIEFSNLETFFANRKGGHNKRFHLPSDTEALKKLNAVQCLREIVSNEQETTAIEQLVDELCEKLQDIEKRTQELNHEQRFLIDTQLHSEGQSHHTADISGGGSSGHHQGICSQTQYVSRAAHVVTVNDSRRHLAGDNDIKDTDNDPKKRYFRAFPALTKEMEDSFRTWRRSAKSLTWPVVGRSIVADSSLTSNSNSASSSTSSSNFDGNISSDKIVEKKLDEVHSEEELNTQNVRPVIDIGGGNSERVVTDAPATAIGSSASAKKKSKRRRNQALPKGRTTQSIRKVTIGNSNCNIATGGNKFYNQHHYTHHRKTSPTWDTDFKGCWEMGPDLIKEFLSRQKAATKSSRSTSESMDIGRRNECNSKEVSSHGEEFYPGTENSVTKHDFDFSFCFDDDDRQHYDIEDGVDYVDEDYDGDNTLTSVPELAGDLGNPRRLYQREAILPKPSVLCGVVYDNNFGGTSDSVNQMDFDSLKAKFNSSVEALWKEPEPQTSIQSDATATKGNSSGISSAFYATTSLNVPAPFKHDLWNFWSNYNQHHYDPVAKFSTAASTSSMITTRLDDSSASSGAGADIANSSDYFSMPSNLDDFDKSVGALRRTNDAGASLGAHTPSINVFLQNSIWSSSGDCVDGAGAAMTGETDESFFYKVWHSNKKLSQLDVGNNKDEKISDADFAIGFKKPKEQMINFGGDGGGGAKLDFPPYNRLKWSEGINAGPSYNNLRPNNVPTDMGGMESLQMTDNKFASFCPAATMTGANWEAPVYGQNSQPDLKSWCASNPISLTEMYGSDVCDSISQELETEGGKVDADGPIVTLPNHCATTSGFIAYSRIKKSGLVPPQIKPVSQQSASATRIPKDYFHGGEEENLLTSESTHFHPIENFVDGHSFDISNALDVVQFERSGSGYLCYESNEYAEYTRNDVYLADEEVTKSKWMKMVTYKPCDTLSPKKQSHQSLTLMPKEDEADEGKDMFVIKFRLKRTGEVACQTEETDFQLAADKMAEQGQSLQHMDMPMFHNNSLAATIRQDNNEAIIAAVTKAMAAAAKAAAHQGLYARHSSMPWVPVTTQDCSQSWVQDTSLCDEVDFCKVAANAEQLNQFWSMQEVEKQCHQRRLPVTSFQRAVDIDRHDDNSLDSSSHTLWGMCAVCNSCDYGKSMPANRLLRDELELEADEIMSDLRYMQDLYIGEAGDCCPDNVDNDSSNETCKTVGCQEDNIIIDAGTAAVDHVQATMLQKVNQLIEDLLRPEQTGKFIKITNGNESKETNSPAGSKYISNVWSTNTSGAVVEDNAHSWHYGNEPLRNVWQHESENENKFEVDTNPEKRKYAFIKPMNLLRQVGGSLSGEELYMDKLNWEHDHLAKIWHQDVIMSPNESAFQEQQREDDNDGETDKEMDIVKENDEIVEKKNLKNLQCVPGTSPSANPSAAATYKRVQQFLNTSAAKLKLAANRKRRHSASQNFYHHQQQQHQHQQHLHNYNNNNNDNITDLNRYQQNIATSAAPEDLLLPQEPKQTIITCKYWTTSTNGTQASLDSAAAAMMLLAAATNSSKADGSIIASKNYDDDNDEKLILEENTFGNTTLSCLIDKNASILKHVTMMTRPLTR